MEILIVIAILAILVAAGVSSFMSAQKKSRDVKRKNDLRQISLALESYFTDKGRFPASDADGKMAGCGTGDAEICEWGEIFQDQNNTVYMLTIPGDAQSGRTYMYTAEADGSKYQLYARLENTEDSAVPQNAQNEARVFTDMVCSTSGTPVYCNYGVASSNKTVEEGRTIDYE